VCLRFVYLLAVRIVPALGLWQRGDDHKTVEILLLRHQLADLQRQLAETGKRPRPDWADRAIIALLVGLIPKARRVGLRLFVTPDTCAGTATFGNVQSVMSPAGIPLWTSQVYPRSEHATAMARGEILGTVQHYLAELQILADCGYEGAITAHMSR
jgi:hypothetical protein